LAHRSRLLLTVALLAGPLAVGVAGVAPALADCVEGDASTVDARKGSPKSRDSGLSDEEAAALEADFITRKSDGVVVPASVTIPVVLHVVDGPNARVSDPEITNQMKVLNQAYRGDDRDTRFTRAPGVDTGVAFTLQQVRRIPDPTGRYQFLQQGSKAEDELKAGRVGGYETLNVYITKLGGLLGWGTYPTGKAQNLQYDGVVIEQESLPGGLNAGDPDYGFPDGGKDPYDGGKTLAHEVGHWLGLYHTFQGGCNAKGDYVSDTPSQRFPNFGCPIRRDDQRPDAPDTCAEPGVDPIHNYMDYSSDECLSQFSFGQGSRMRAMWAVYRAAA